MRKWKPEIPECHIAKAILSVTERRNAILAAQEITRNKLNKALQVSHLSQEEVSAAASEYSVSNKLVDEVRQEASVLRASLQEKIDILRVKIASCNGLIKDALHYTELYRMPAGKAARLNKVLRETLRTKRVNQDELALLVGALHDLNGTATKGTPYQDGHYRFHLGRLKAKRSYNHRELTLAQILELKFPDTLMDPIVTLKLSRFDHIKSIKR